MKFLLQPFPLNSNMWPITQAIQEKSPNVEIFPHGLLPLQERQSRETYATDGPPPDQAILLYDH